MTISLYEMQSAAAFCCSEAKEDLDQPESGSKLECLGYLVMARCLSLLANIKAITDLVPSLFSHTLKIIHIPIAGGCSFDTIVRVAISIILVASLAMLRIAISIGGILTPELTFGVLKLHKVLLYWGLFCRAQYFEIATVPNQWRGFINPQLWVAIISQYGDQRFRSDIVRNAGESIYDQELNRSSFVRENFRQTIWNQAITDALLARLGIFLGDFLHTVRVPHPILEEFQKSFLDNLHGEALSLLQKKLYAADEIEDQITAWNAVINCAVYKAIISSICYTEKEVALGRGEISITRLRMADGKKAVFKDLFLSDGNTLTVREIELTNGAICRSLAKREDVDGIVQRGSGRIELEERVEQVEGRVKVYNLTLADGRVIEGGDAGDLDLWRDSLLEIVLCLQEMDDADKEALFYYLCTDEERIAKVRSDLRPLTDNPAENPKRKRLYRCFQLICSFSTIFMARNLPPDTRSLQDAFKVT